jgi:hypothetical protein
VAVSFLISQALAALFEVDEIKQEKLPNGKLRVTFVTSGIHPDLAKIKTALWAFSAIPVQRVDEVKIEELQAGPIIKRYQITVTLAPLIGGIKREE